MGEKSRAKRERRGKETLEVARSVRPEKDAPFVKLLLDWFLQTNGPLMRDIVQARRHREELIACLGDDEWPAEVYVPTTVLTFMQFAAAEAAHSEEELKSHEIRAAIGQSIVESQASTCLALAAWQEGQAIYRFHSELADALAETPMNSELPVEVLRRMPHRGTYIEVVDTDLESKSPELLGTVAAIAFYDMLNIPIGEDDSQMSLTECLRLLPIFDPRGNSQAIVDFSECALSSPFAIPLLEGSTAERCISMDSEPFEEAPALLNMFMNMVLYLCSEAPDISLRTVGAARGRRGAGWQRPIREWDVGYRIAASLTSRRASASDAGEPGLGRERPRPHIRAAHWHGYWYGPVSHDKRHFKMKWVAPTLVNARSSDQLVPVIHDASAIEK